MYDGYHFTPASPDIFNPYSLINCLHDCRLDSYWFGSGTPTYLIEMMKKFDVLPSCLKAEDVEAADFDAPTESLTSLTPLLYQSGYITIKDYNEEIDTYTLDIPNTEVRVGLMRSLLPHYVTPNTIAASSTVAKMKKCLARDDMDGALRLLQAFLSTVPYCDNTHYEGHWQQVLYIIFSLLGNYADVEVHTPTGRIDLVAATKTRLYIVEVKLDKTAASALAQINLKDYAKRFSLYTLPVTKVGVSFDAERHTLAEWVIE